MDPFFSISRGASLQNIEEEEGEIEVPLSSQVSSSSQSRTLGSPLSTAHRRYRRNNMGVSSFLSVRLGSFDSDDDDMSTMSPLAGAEEWENSRADINMPPNFTMADVDLSPTGLGKRMRDLLTDSKFWIRMVDRLGYDRKVFDSDDAIPSLDHLCRYYDSSDLGLLRVFHLFDSDRDRLMSKEEMERGLVQHGLITDVVRARPAVEELFELCSDSGKEVVSPLEFLLAMKALRLAAILYPFSLLSEKRRNVIASREMDLHFTEYREDFINTARPLADPIDFLFKLDEEPLDPRSRVQWIHCHEPSRRAVLAIAIQLGLDPRYVLDVFTLWREQAKADRVRELHGLIPNLHQYDGTEWVFLVVPIVRLTWESKKSSLEPYFEWRRNLHRLNRPEHNSEEWPDIHIEVESCNLAIFVSGKKKGRGTVVTFTSEWVGLSRLEVLNDCCKFSPSRSSLPFHVIESKELDLDMFPKVLKVLDTSYSHLRTGDAFTLVLKTISDCCEEYVKVVDAYDAAIEALREKLRLRRDKLSESDVKQIQRSGRHLSQIHRIVRPVTGIIEILSQGDNDWGAESALYVSDISSNVTKCLTDCEALIESTELLRKQFQQIGKRKTGSVLYLLTLVTTIFAPAEFIATVYGMNFKNRDDTSHWTAPELGWKHGYVLFWIVVLVTVSVIFTFYRKKSWI